MTLSSGAAGTTPSLAFAKILSSYHQKYAEAGPSSAQLDTPIRYDAVVDEEGGMISALLGSLEEFLEANKSSAHGAGALSPDEFDSLKLEHRTWSLIRAVYDNRLHREDPAFEPPSAEDQLNQSPYTTPEDLVQAVVNGESDLSLWATLVEHLQTRPLFQTSPPVEARHGYIPSTIRKAKAAQLKTGAAQSGSLDPDFTLRDPHGRSLAGEDQTYQKPLLEKLWDLVRHGELDQAVEVCEQGGEPWRAASLLGGRRWYMGGLTPESADAAAMAGNRARALWKKSCRAIAKNPTLSASERQLYAALISDLPTLLPACQTWEDQLWAHILHRLESRIDRRWRELGGFWEQEDQLIGRDDEETVEQGQGGLEEVFDAIASGQQGQIGEAAQNPYYVAQRYIVLGRAEALLNTFANRLGDLESSVAPDRVAPLVRFFAHIVLVLRSLSQPVPVAAANAVIEAYLRILEREGNDSLVAMYAACLREGSGEESYARFLRAMDPTASRATRNEALLRAKQHNLDVAIIAQETVRQILEAHFASVPSLQSSQPDVTTFSTSLNDRDVYLIRAIEWLTMVPETLSEALARSNDVARYFLALGHASAARSLLESLPAAINDLSDEDWQFTEHSDYVDLFNVFACHDRIEELLSQQPAETAPKADQNGWRKRLLAAIEKTIVQTKLLLTADWLRFHISSATAYGSQRKKELRRIRQIFVPDLVMRLHKRLVDDRHRFPQLLQEALDLTKIVASEEYHVYEEFLGRDNRPYRLYSYLDHVREASMFALEGGSTDAFRVKT